MSKRRKAGEIVYKQPMAGFVGEGSYAIIHPEDEQSYGVYYCMLDCGDPDCREWLTLFECDREGTLLGGVACHVSECEMEDRD
jgi:hypothetical protein